MTMCSGERPFVYEDQPFPIRIPAGWSPGVMNEAAYLGSVVFNVNQLGQAWFAALAELRSMPSGHPAAGHYSSGIIGRSIIYLGPNGIDDPTTIIHDVPEPDPSGTEWTDPNGIPGYIQFDVFNNYIEDLRFLHNIMFSGIAQDYNGFDYEDIRDQYLRGYFPGGSGYRYTQPLLGSGADAISVAEVQYNPYPRIAGQSLWLPSGEVSKNINDGWQWCSVGRENHVDVIAGTQAEYKTNDHLNRNFSSWPGFLPYTNEIFAKFGPIDNGGPVFPACQTLDGRIVSLNQTDPSGEATWWGDIAALGKTVGLYNLSNQAGVAHDSISDPYTNYVIDMDVSGFIGIMYYAQWAPYMQDWYCKWDTIVEYRNTLEVESPLDIIWKQLEPLNIGYDPSDFILGYMGYYKQEHANTVRIDGDAINSGKTSMAIIGSGDDGHFRYSSSSIIMQSGSREIGDYQSRNVHVGVNWQRYPATYHGFPSYSGEPVNQIAIATTPIPISINGLDTRRAWFQMPDTTTPGDGEQALVIQSPLFANRNNVKQILVEDKNSVFDNDGILTSGIAAPSGELSIWPQDKDYNHGSGVGYHVMDNGIWMRRGPTNCGMTLISPYNGQRLLFKKAEDRSIVFGHETNVWRTELRTTRPRDLAQGQFISVYGHDLTVWVDGDKRFQDFTEERAYHVSWYISKDEHAVHTDGKYIAYNIAAQSPNVKIDHSDYFGDDKICGYPKGFNAGGISTDDDGTLVNKNWFVSNDREDLIPPISFVDNYFKYSPLRSQATFIDSVESTRRQGTVVVTGQVEIYIANKPYCVWDIPGLEIQNTGVATVDMHHTLLESLMEEGLTPAASVSTITEWVRSAFQPTPHKALTQKWKGNDGWLVLRLQMFGLQESSKGGILEGWGRLFGTAAAGITSFRYYPQADPPLPLPGTWRNPRSYITFQGGWDSVPKYRTFNVGTTVTWASGPLGMYEGSRPFRVWIDINDPTVIHCVDDLFDSGAYGLIHDDKIWRYHAADKDPIVERIPIFSTQENTTFIPGDVVDTNALRCIKSITYIEDEVIAAVDVYRDANFESLDDLSRFTFNRQFEIATISFDSDEGYYKFDNQRAQMIYRDPGRRFMKYLKSPTQGMTAHESRLDPFEFMHNGYQNDKPAWNHVGADIAFKSNEMCDMWPKIVYASIA